MVTVLPQDGKQSSCLGLAFLTQVHVVTLSGCGCHCATPFCTTGSMPADEETTALSLLFSFQYLLRLFPRDALHSPRSLGIGRLRETVKLLTGSPWP